MSLVIVVSVSGFSLVDVAELFSDWISIVMLFSELGLRAILLLDDGNSD